MSVFAEEAPVLASSSPRRPVADDCQKPAGRSVLYQADALLALPTLATGSVDVVITDPPYNSGGRTNSERYRQSARRKYVSTGAQHDLSDFIGDNRDQRGYVSWLATILAECRRITRERGHLLVFSDWRQTPATSDALQIAGWTWRGTLTWHKPVARPRRGGFKAESEYILWASNGPIDSHRDLYLPGIFSASQPQGRKRQHITEKPVPGLLAELVKIAPEGAKSTILDPFAGSGSTGEAALRSGRSWVGIELSDHYADVAQQRLTDVRAALHGIG